MKDSIELNNVYVVFVLYVTSLKVLYEVHKYYESSSPCSQEPVTWLYPKQGTVYPLYAVELFFFNIRFNIILEHLCFCPF
jgi:hypothetical protein